jgi:hypothetical protein
MIGPSDARFKVISPCLSAVVLRLQCVVKQVFSSWLCWNPAGGLEGLLEGTVVLTGP